MNPRHLQCLITAAFGLALLLSTLPEAADAKTISRSCSAYYAVKIKTIDRHNVNIDFKLEEFSATGRCKSIRPNDCRRKARDAAHSCMQRHWEYQWTEAKPAACASSSLSGYDTARLESSLQREVCRRACQNYLGSSSSVVGFDVTRVTTGDKGCGPNLDKTRKASLAKGERVRCTPRISGGRCE